MSVGQEIESAKLNSGNRRGQTLAVEKAAESVLTRDLMQSWSVMPPEQPLFSSSHAGLDDDGPPKTMVVVPGVGAVLPRTE